MNITVKLLLAVLALLLICLISPAFALDEGFPSKSVPETLSPAWFPAVIAGMIGLRYVLGKKKNN